MTFAPGPPDVTFTPCPPQSFLVCPLCYNQPPFQGVAKGMSCSRCPHDSCPHSRPQHWVCSCRECEGGVMVLEPHLKTGASGAQKWRISCNNVR